MPDVPTVLVADLPDDAVLLDVREDAEWAAGHIDGAVHVPMNDVPARLAGDADSSGPLTPGASVVVLCKVGGRSAMVTDWLRGRGVDAINLDGGMLAWAAAGRPMVTDDGSEPVVL